MASQRFPELARVGCLPAAALPPNIMAQSLGGLLIGIAADISWIRFIGKASLSWEGKLVNGGRQETATLTFKTLDPLPLTEPLAFVAVAASGRQYVVGAREPRHCVVNYVESVGERDGDGAVRTYTVTHRARKSVIPCRV